MVINVVKWVKIAEHGHIDRKSDVAGFAVAIDHIRLPTVVISFSPRWSRFRQSLLLSCLFAMEGSDVTILEVTEHSDDRIFAWAWHKRHTFGTHLSKGDVAPRRGKLQ